jgi:hypothetical protein
VPGLSQATKDAIKSSSFPFIGGDAQGDSLFKTWQGQHFDFHIAAVSF